MQKKTRTLLLLGLGFVVATAAIAASGPKFLRAPSATLASPTGKLAAGANSTITIPGVVIGWSEVGLGNTGTVDYMASANAAAVYQCVNRGTNCPSAANKQDVFARATVFGTFRVENGRINGELRLDAPPSTLSCPGNQVVGVASVVFTDIRLDDLTNGISAETKPNSLAYENKTICP
jgi:hypothetical protein